MRLTQRVIENLVCPSGKKDVLVSDDDQKGLYVRIGNGARKGSLARKTYLAQYWLGASRRIRLDSCSAISLAAARDAVRIIRGDVAKGRDPADERKRATQEARRKAVLTLDVLLEQWAALHLAGKRPRYAAEAVRAVRRTFAAHLNAPAEVLNRKAVVRTLDRLAEDGHAVMASRTAAYGRACYHWAIKRGSLETNPFVNLPAATTAIVVKRERVLTDGELHSLWRATVGPGPFNAIVRMLLLTGQRREEVAGMAWSELASDLSTWTIPASRAKNGAEHIVPLSSQAQAIIHAAPCFEGTDLVFPGRHGPFNGFSKAKEALDEASGVTGWRLHDLRRTLATGLQRLGVRLEVTEAVLNHVSGSRAGIIGIYQRYAWTLEKCAALALWSAHVAAVVEGREAEANVVPLSRRLAREGAA